MKTLTLKPGIDEIIKSWHAAKETERTWQEYRRQLEEVIASHYEQEFNEVRAQLAQSVQLSETVKLADLKVSVGRTMAIEQTQAAMFCSAHPELLGVILRYEFKPVNSSSVLGAAHAEGALGQEVTKMIEIKDSKLSFSKA